MGLIQQKEIYLNIAAEQNGALVANRWNFSFGNGNEHNGANINDWGWIAHYEGTIVSLSVGMRLTNTAATTIRTTVNGAATPAQITLPSSTTKYVQAVNLPFNALDVINFQTVTPGGGNDVVVSALVKLSLP